MMFARQFAIRFGAPLKAKTNVSLRLFAEEGGSLFPLSSYSLDLSSRRLFSVSSFRLAADDGDGHDPSFK